MEIQDFIRARLAETTQSRCMTILDLRTLEAHSGVGPPCQTLREMAARWADHPDYQEITWVS